MSHLTLWMRPVGAGAGEHQEGQQGEVQQVLKNMFQNTHGTSKPL